MKIIDELKLEHEKVQEMIFRTDNIPKRKEKLHTELAVAVIAHHEAETAIIFQAMYEERKALNLKEKLNAEHDCLHRQMQVILDCEDTDKSKAIRKAVRQIFIAHMRIDDGEPFPFIHLLSD